MKLLNKIQMLKIQLRISYLICKSRTMPKIRKAMALSQQQLSKLKTSLSERLFAHK